MKEQQQKIATSLAQIAIDVNSKVSAMSVTYDELMSELLYFKEKYDKLVEENEKSKKAIKPVKKD